MARFAPMKVGRNVLLLKFICYCSSKHVDFITMRRVLDVLKIYLSKKHFIAADQWRLAHSQFWSFCKTIIFEIVWLSNLRYIWNSKSLDSSRNSIRNSPFAHEIAFYDKIRGINKIDSKIDFDSKWNSSIGMLLNLISLTNVFFLFR